MATTSKATSKSTTKNFVQSEIITGTAMYAKVHRPDPGNPKLKIAPAYKVDLLLDTKEALAKAKSLNLPIKEKESYSHPYVVFKAKVMDDREPPPVIDSQKNRIPKSILIGNGSRVRLRFLPYVYGEGDVTAILQEFQVLDLKRYEPMNTLDTVNDGFVLDPSEAEDASSPI